MLKSLSYSVLSESGLSKLPKNFSHLERLITLHLNNMPNLELPVTDIDMLKSLLALRYLNISRCRKLSEEARNTLQEWKLAEEKIASENGADLKEIKL